MPKEGYVSITFPTWILEAADIIIPPGQNIQAYFYNNVLLQKISVKQLKEIHDKWVAKYYPLGGVKTLEISELNTEGKNDL